MAGVASQRAPGPILVADRDDRARARLVATVQRAGFDTRETKRGDEALRFAREEAPLLVILEIPLQGLSGYEVCRALRAEHGDDLPIVFVSGSRTESYDRVAGLLIGADDYLTKPYAEDELLVRLRRLIERARPVTGSVASRLTKRELEVLRLLAAGLGSDEISQRLYISSRTVGTHIEHILTKLQVHNRTQAVALAYREDLIEAVA